MRTSQESGLLPPPAEIYSQATTPVPRRIAAALVLTRCPPLPQLRACSRFRTNTIDQLALNPIYKALPMLEAGQRLRALREKIGLTVRDVEAASNKLAARHRTPEYAISISRLSDFETKDILPNIYKLYSLAVIYRRTFSDLLS